jgi:hypothetical protein
MNVNLLLYHLHILPGISNCTLKQNAFRSDRTIEGICSCPYELYAFRSILGARKDVLSTVGMTHEASLPVHEAYTSKYKLPVAPEYYHVVITTKICMNIMDRRLEGNTWRMLRGGERVNLRETWNFFTLPQYNYISKFSFFRVSMDKASYYKF